MTDIACTRRTRTSLEDQLPEPGSYGGLITGSVYFLG